MKYFNLKFTSENLDRHLRRDKFFMTTTRDVPKGEVGDITIIDDDVWYLYEIKYMSLRVLKHINSKIWENEGFKSMDEYIYEIKHIYGPDMDKKYCIMNLRRVKLWAKIC